MSLNDRQAVTLPTGLNNENSPKQGIFARFETKFFLSKKNVAHFKSELGKYMSPSYPSPETVFTGVESIYFDSPDLQIYRMHFAEQTKRFKIRVRRYAPNGILDDRNIHLELKSKTEGVSRKARFQIASKHLKILWSGDQIAISCPDLSACNRDLTDRELKERIGRINELVMENRLQPSCIVRYQREAFEERDIRLTIDDQISFETVRNFSENQLVLQSDSKLSEGANRMRASFDSRDCLLVEVKHAGVVPPWLVGILRSNDCSKAKFSKYCYSVTSQIQAGFPKSP
jgi:SPX domain protein involved in polyphosphate accumulation